MLDGSVPMGLGNSLLLSLIGMLVVFMELIILAFIITLISKAVRAATERGEQAPAPAAAAPAPVAAAPAAAAPVAAAPVAAPGLTLTDVDAPSAAAVMAIVSDKTGIPLNHLAFHSIKGVIEMDGVEERDAAVIMALVANKLGKPVNKLIFKSIKKVD
ncbi:OadG family transporter subunit [Angelakisella massiliensis]|uniref:OadG family transporter subunit n=1 Tax=Angelakisella massiliensis TaxID=1871018 RepID=UPI0023A804F3|nr:OadG family transporter subunit [Angelakisella massiliensis]